MRVGPLVLFLVVAVLAARGTQSATAGGTDFIPACPPTITENCATIDYGYDTIKAGIKGSGRVTSLPAGLDCTVTRGVRSGTCSHRFTWPTVGVSTEFAYSVTFTPAPGSLLTYLGDVTSQPRVYTGGSLKNGDLVDWFGELIGFFLSPEPQRVTVAKSGSGAGRVTSSTPPGLDCGLACSQTFRNGSDVTLSARPDRGSVFKQWIGACSGKETTCTLSIAGPVSTFAVFERSASTPPPPPPPASPPPPPPSPTPPPPSAADRRLAAEFVSGKAGWSALGRRVVRVEIAADEKISVALALTRARRGIAGKRITALEGVRVLTLVLPNGVRRGWATLTVTLADAAGNSRKATRRVKV